jgi:hypothetical protein
MPPPLSRRLVEGYPWHDRAPRTAEDLGAMESTVVEGPTVRFAVGDLPEDRALVRREDVETVLLLPHHLRLCGTEITVELVEAPSPYAD